MFDGIFIFSKYLKLHFNLTKFSQSIKALFDISTNTYFRIVISSKFLHPSKAEFFIVLIN